MGMAKIASLRRKGACCLLPSNQFAKESFSAGSIKFIFCYALQSCIYSERSAQVFDPCHGPANNSPLKTRSSMSFRVKILFKERWLHSVCSFCGETVRFRPPSKGSYDLGVWQDKPKHKCLGLEYQKPPTNKHQLGRSTIHEENAI